ncbi:MAG TPA: hypothetical protein VGZ51_07300, partial [Actinomycetota bacterium]|nr:hypothetical protein [Actinomycetota bacterium]
GARLLSMPSVEEGPEEIARWIAERTGGPVPRFKKVELRLRGRARLVADRAWAGTCRQLMIALDDRTYHFASFRFTK